jgi:hypothetical protein
MVESSQRYHHARALSFGARGIDALFAGGTTVAHRASNLDKMD